jgi:hypothetical protein
MMGSSLPSAGGWPTPPENRDQAEPAITVLALRYWRTSSPNSVIGGWIDPAALMRSELKNTSYPFFLVGEQSSEFLVIEADQIEIEIFVLKSSQLKPQQFLVPSGIFGQFVISKDVRALLGLAEVI